MKINSRFEHGEFSQLLITQPNQAFSPRQILEQFARNEIVPTFNQSSDILDDEHFSDDQLLDEDVIEFDDAMEAQQHLIENQYELFQNEGNNQVSGDSSQNSGEENSGMQSTAE